MREHIHRKIAYIEDEPEIQRRYGSFMAKAHLIFLEYILLAVEILDLTLILDWPLTEKIAKWRV
jgi:hypothetical protein